METETENRSHHLVGVLWLPWIQGLESFLNKVSIKLPKVTLQILK